MVLTAALPAPATDALTLADGGFLADQLAPSLVSGVIYGLILALASIGVSLIYGTTRLNNFAHGDLVTFGGFVAVVAMGSAALPAWAAVLLAFIIGGLFGWVQDALLWRPLRRRRVGVIPLMIVSIGLSLVLRYLYAFLFGPDRIVLPVSSDAWLVVGGVRLRMWDVLGSLIAVALLVATALLLTRSRIGKATRAVADNPALAAASGIDVNRIIRVVWTGGTALAAVAGVLLAFYQTQQWDTGASVLLLIFASVVLGGLGTAYGALVGALIIGIAVNVSSLFLPGSLKFVTALVIMIIVLLVRPQGILGRPERIG